MIYGILTEKRHATKLVNFSNKINIDYIISTSKYACEEFNFDIGVCYSYPYLIDVSAPYNKGRTFYNFHPAILPEYGDWGNYARGMHELQNGKLKEWGVSLHCIDKGIDIGTVLRVLKIPLLSIPTDVSELGDISHYYLFNLFKMAIHALQFKPKTKEELDKLC
jgi:folate-dependent phosphoribosylglycinamide formyltransferase PurN